MSIKLHPRTQVVEVAKRDINEAVWALIRKHDLTYWESITILTSIHSEIAKYGIRVERNPGDVVVGELTIEEVVCNPKDSMKLDTGIYDPVVCDKCGATVGWKRKGSMDIPPMLCSRCQVKENPE